MQYIQVLESNLDSEGLYIYNIYCLGIRITPVIKTIKSTELQIHLFQVLPKLAACLYGLVFLILYYATVVLKFQIIPVDFFFFSKFFFLLFFSLAVLSRSSLSHLVLFSRYFRAFVIDKRE